MMKRLVAILSAVVLLCSICCVAGASQDQAQRLGSRAIGMNLRVNESTRVYRAPWTEDVGVLTTLNPGDTRTVWGYIRNSNTHKYWYLICWSDGDNGWWGWVSANNVTLDESSVASVSSYGYGYCIITNSGTCKARSGPGTGYSQVGICVQGNGFLVMDIRRGDNGKNWYNISVDGISCWISEGLADYYAY